MNISNDVVAVVGKKLLEYVVKDFVEITEIYKLSQGIVIIDYKYEEKIYKEISDIFSNKTKRLYTFFSGIYHLMKHKKNDDKFKRRNAVSQPVPLAEKIEI